MSNEFAINRGVRQRDPLSPKLFAAVMEEVFKKASISEEMQSLKESTSMEENLTNLRFAGNVALLNEKTKQMEKHLNSLNSESLKDGLKIHKGFIKYMTNHADGEDILTDQVQILKVTEFKYLGQNHTPQRHYKRRNLCQDQSSMELFWKRTKKKNDPRQTTPHFTKKKKQVMGPCVLPTITYGCQTWSLNKQLANRLRTAQRAMERKILGIKLQDTIQCS